MIRQVVGQQLDHDPNFRWRGEAVTRIENLSDIAFALALGMIISGADVPSTFSELKRFLFFLIPTAAAFGVMLQIWTIHFTFFRRYGVADKTIITLNSILIFVVLYLAYPLRFTFESLYAWIIGQSTGDYTLAIELGMVENNAALTIAFYVVAYGVCLGLLALKYGHVIRRRDILDLNAHELVTTRITRGYLAAGAIMSFVIIPLALYTPAGPMAAFLLFTLMPIRHVLTRYYQRGLVKTAADPAA